MVWLIAQACPGYLPRRKMKNSARDFIQSKEKLRDSSSNRESGTEEVESAILWQNLLASELRQTRGK